MLSCLTESDRGYASGLHAVVTDNSLTSKACEKIETRLRGMSVFLTRKHFEAALKRSNPPRGPYGEKVLF